ncbi:hypothetical protein D8B29_18755 [Verminephrobacter eiseniae]|nr:hypothetical protein [Verminephrobacter eiseniae]MCW5304743.1 hypothetical protein [Verminephrobacter eiseniae]MCW8181551.1 hypothetical protein [Verminephrobacter eiseniae]MCW8192592.1 hypothetical protein [Verminephrobacter eiseniae]
MGGGTDVDMLRALAERMGHPVASIWDERINTFYVQNNYPQQDTQAELERVQGGFGVAPREHFNGLRNLLPDLKGLAILDNDGQNRQDRNEGALETRYWRRYEVENYFITPDLLRTYARNEYPSDDSLADETHSSIEEALAEVITEQVFDGARNDYQAWTNSPPDAMRLVWEAKTERRKLSTVAEEFFRKLAARMGGAMLLTKGELHRLVPLAPTAGLSSEITQKLDCLAVLFAVGQMRDETVTSGGADVGTLATDPGNG